MNNDPRGHSRYRRLAKLVVGVGRPCYWCGAPATTADHLIPVSHDPSRAKDRANLVPACRHCNQSRGNRAAPRQRVVGRSVFSTQRNHIPVYGRISTHNPRRFTLAPDYTGKVADGSR